jgi:hypothetical protein
MILAFVWVNGLYFDWTQHMNISSCPMQ